MKTMNGARAKLEEILNASRGKLGATLEMMDTEQFNRTSKVYKAPVIDFEVNGGVRPVLDGEVHDITNHALGGMFSQLKMPKAYADTLMEDGQTELLSKNLKERTEMKLSKGALVRSVSHPPSHAPSSNPDYPDIEIPDPTRLIKGWLTPAYKIMDCVPLMRTFMEECAGAGMLPYNAYNTDYRVKTSFLFDSVVDLAGDFVVFGASFIGGDYGGVANTVNLEMLRLVCTNGMTAFDALRKVHMGRRFTGEGDSYMISQSTIDKDQATIQSAIRDVVKIIPEQAESLKGVMLEAQKKEIDTPRALMMLRRNGLKKDIAERVAAVYENDDNVENVPEAKTLYRLSQAIGLVAQDRALVKSDDEILDLQKASYTIMAKAS